VDKEQIKSIVHHYDMYDDEYDDTWDGINEFNVNIDNNDDDKDGNAEGDEAEKVTIKYIIILSHSVYQIYSYMDI